MPSVGAQLPASAATLLFLLLLLATSDPLVPAAWFVTLPTAFLFPSRIAPPFPTHLVVPYIRTAAALFFLIPAAWRLLLVGHAYARHPALLAWHGLFD